MSMLPKGSVSSNNQQPTLDLLSVVAPNRLRSLIFRVGIRIFLLAFALLIPIVTEADSWDVSGDSYYSMNGCYAPQANPDPNGCYGSATDMFSLGNQYLQSNSASTAVLCLAGSNKWQNTTMSSAGAYDTGAWYDGNSSQTPVPTLTYYPSDDTCGGGGGGGGGVTATSTTATSTIQLYTELGFNSLVLFFAALIVSIWIWRMFMPL